uniref:Cathepsin propeptide inhibitor domain-containing protein n=1 Tax=Oryza nivara TaxID=4536 RepID=A0A0E0GUN4_ORYNI
MSTAALVARLARDVSAARDAARLAAAAASRAARSSAVASSNGPEPADDETDKDFETDLVDSVTDKDFESDEAIWAFYERWCKAYDKERDHAEMAHRFKIFKETAELVHRSNKDAPEEEKLCFGPYCDGFDEQQRAEFLLKFGHFHGIHEFVEQWKIDFPNPRKIDSPNQSP